MNSMNHEQQYSQQLSAVKERFKDSILKIETDRVGCPILWVQPGKNVEVLKFLKDTEGFEYHFMADLTAYDDQGQPEESSGRFVIVYNLYSPQHRLRIRVKMRANDGAPVPTAVDLWEAANWAEREVYDMFGVRFDGHPDLRRILMDVRWQGHPLRKDYHWRKYQLFNDPEQIPESLLKEGL